MLGQFAIYVAVAAFIGVAVLGHILLLQAMFVSADRVDGRREHRKPDGIIPNISV